MKCLTETVELDENHHKVDATGTAETQKYGAGDVKQYYSEFDVAVIAQIS